MPKPRMTPTLPNGQWPKPDGYPDHLATAAAIADHIAILSPGDIDEEMVEEHFRGCHARLQWMPMDQLTPGPIEAHVANAKLEARYAKKPLATLPPLVVENGQIEDGHHRYRVALAAGATGLWCYCVEELGDD